MQEKTKLLLLFIFLIAVTISIPFALTMPFQGYTLILTPDQKELLGNISFAFLIATSIISAILLTVGFKLLKEL